MINEYIKNLIRDETKNMLIYKGKKCEKCGEQANCIHHKVYRWKPKIEDIEFLCKKCHDKLKKPRIKIIIEDEINYTLLSRLTKRDLKFIEKVKSLNKKGFFISDVRKIDKRSYDCIRINLKKLELLNIIKKEDSRRNPIFYELMEK